MLLGIWDNIEDLESKINIAELTLLLDANRKKQYEINRFMAAIQGIDLDAHSKQDAKERFDEIQERANRRLYGDQAVEEDSMNTFGLDIEPDED